MPTVDFTKEELLADLDGRVRLVVREELGSVREELSSVRGELSLVRTELKRDIASVRGELKEDIAEVRAELGSIKTMLSEDAKAESRRLTRLEKLTRQHIADANLHNTRPA